MPNTLVHAGIQGITSRAVLRDADLKWVYLGCIIPDLPWILQRLLRITIPDIDLYVLRTYAIIQSSLLGCLIVCAALALMTTRYWRTFVLIGANAVGHLLLDALQTKWANGVHFLAPFSWNLTHWGFFWPESLITYGLTGFGLIYIIGFWRSGMECDHRITVPTRPRIVGILVLTAAYFTAPAAILEQPIDANNHYIQTLRSPDDRTGQYIEFDRVSYLSRSDGNYLSGWNGELIRTQGLPVRPPATVSIKGVFTSDKEIRVLQHHRHLGWFRDGSSLLGLTLICSIWIGSGLRRLGRA